MATPTAVVDLFDTMLFFTYQTFLSLSLSLFDSNEQLKVRPFTAPLFVLRAFNVYQPHAKKSVQVVVQMRFI